MYYVLTNRHYSVYYVSSFNPYNNFSPDFFFFFSKRTDRNMV